MHRRKALDQVPDIDGKTFVFIGGLHRSGTSILHRLLCEHPSTSGFSNTGVAEDEGQHLQSVYRPAHVYGGPGEFAFHPEAHLTEDSVLINQHNREKLLQQWGAYYDLNKPVLLEKSPPNIIMSRFLRQMFPASRFVFIVRHPIAVSLATEKWSNRSLEEMLKHWHQAYSILLDDIEEADDCLLLRYEDFVDTSQILLDQICDFIALPRFSPGEMVANHNEKYFAAWQRQGSSEIDQMQKRLPPNDRLLTRFGYSLEPPFVELSGQAPPITNDAT